MSITIGYDSEFHLLDTDGKCVSAIGKIQGTKDKQYILDTGAGLHHDNVSLEIAFKPFDVFEDMERHIEKTLFEVRNIIHPYTLDCSSSNVFTEDELNCPEAFELGCDPDFNAWKEDMNPIPTVVIEGLRTNGTHVHVGIEELANDFGSHCKFIRCMDESLGIWSLAVDTDIHRRTMYGAAGAFRPKPYGLEYRTLGSFWILTTEHRKEVWSRTIDVARAYQDKLLQEPEAEVAEAINS
jgi:hypothetical protein